MRTGGGGDLILLINSGMLSSSKGNDPDNIANNTTPHDHTSTWRALKHFFNRRVASASTECAWRLSAPTLAGALGCWEELWHLRSYVAVDTRAVYMGRHLADTEAFAEL